MRVILVTGKGGVGKTTLASATALRIAGEGARTLLVSTDAAHSLADVLLQPLSDSPSPIASRLEGLQLDGRRELQRSWDVIGSYLRRLVGEAQLDRLRVDELMVLPGLDQLVALSRLRTLVAAGRWDAIVVDCAPSADSLRLLMLPDVLGWYVERLFGRDGLLGRWAWRRIERTLAVPAPDDDVIASIIDISDELAQLRAVLATSTTTARVVVTPERVVVAEARRTLSYLALYGYSVDAVLINRVPGPELDTAPVLAPWLAVQRAQVEAIEQAFAPLPLLSARLRLGEPIGLELLREVGAELYGARDPLSRLATASPIEIATQGRNAVVKIFIPGIQREHIVLEQVDGELIVTLGEHRRAIQLPDSLLGHEVVRAGLDGAHLEIVLNEAMTNAG